MRVAIIKVGSTLPAVAARRGDFEHWLMAGMGVSRNEVSVVDVVNGAPLPAPKDVDGAIVTGSAAMVTDKAEWSERTALWLRTIVEAKTPFLGVCYGHQLLAHAMGGKVARNPRGREIGTVEVRLTPDAERDALLKAFPSVMRFQATHVESVLELPKDAIALAENDADPFQAFRIGTAAWGVQFHPEFDADIIRGYIEGRRPILESESLKPDALLSAATDSDHGTQLLRRFREQIAAFRG